MIIVGDVHGCFDTLMALVKKFPKDQKLCFVGDLIDRGPKSYDVVQWVIDNGHDCVLGNHEQMAIQSTYSWDNFQDWNRNGGVQCRFSYPEKELSKEHLEFYKSLPIFRLYEEDENIRDDGRALLVSHTGFRRPYDKIDPEHHKEECIWNRRKPLRQEGIFQVIGHTPVRKPLIEQWYANIDTGCYIPKTIDEKYGRLTALQFPDMIVYEQDCIDYLDWNKK